MNSMIWGLLIEMQCHAHVKTKKTLKRPSESEVARNSKAKTVNRKRKDEDTVRGSGI